MKPHTPTPDRPPQSNRCARCGSVCADSYTGYTCDRMAARDPLFCDACTLALEVEDEKA